MPVDVSVVMATYNTGDALGATVDSVRRQTIGTDRLELVVVDDGSTDGTGERALELAERETWVSARTIENSGWPSRPRNVAISLARGRYIMVMDHDDLLFPHALERMVAAADEASADVVVGKEVRTGARTAGLDTFRRNSRQTHPIRDDMLTMLTPHRLWRREFLERHQVRFSETLRRLEDHKIIAETYEHDPVVAVVADLPCYQWVIHGDNNSLRLPDPIEYYGALREVLDSVDRWPHDADVKDGARATWLRTTVLDRFGPSGFATWPQDYRARFFEAARSVVLDRLPPALDDQLPAGYRVRAALLRRGEVQGLLDYLESDSSVTTGPVLTTWSTRAGLELVVETQLLAGQGPVRFVRDNDRIRQLPTGPLDPAVADQALYVTEELRTARIDILLTERSTNAEWFMPTDSTCELVEDGPHLVLRIRARGTIDPSTALLGSPLTQGVWDLRLRSLLLGYDSRTTVRVPDGQEVPAAFPGASGLVIAPYRTKSSRLALKVSPARRPAAARRPEPSNPLGHMARRFWRMLARRITPASR